MTDDRKEPHLSGIDDPGPRQDRIPTLSEVVSPDLFDIPLPDPDRAPETSGPEAGAEPPDTDLSAASDDVAERLGTEDDILRRQPKDEPAQELPDEQATAFHDAVPERAAAPIPEEEIEALSDHVLDRIAPALREAVSAAVTELLDRHGRDRR